MQTRAVKTINDRILSPGQRPQTNRTHTADRKAQYGQPGKILVGNSHRGGFSEEYMAGKARQKTRQSKVWPDRRQRETGICDRHGTIAAEVGLQPLTTTHPDCFLHSVFPCGSFPRSSFMRASGALVQVFQTRSGAAQPSRTTSVLTSLLLFSVCCCTHLAVAAPASAALPPETRKELTELQKQLKETTALLKKNEVEKVREILDSVEKRVTELAIPEDEKDRAWTTLKTALEKAKYAFPVSFEKEVAPIVKTNCIRCHSEAQASANLRLDTYAAIAKGGRSGPVVFPRVPNRSLLAVKLIHPDEKMRMPQGAAKLKDPEILTVVRWIEQGAGFDGEDRDAPIGDSLVEKKPPVQVAMADGSETVSFRKDIAPMI
jgi:hypothetical protein